eukprot:2192922-Prymnesium_polylepis.1
MIAYLFINVEQMAIEIEQPFGDDANDLPLELYILDLEKVRLAHACQKLAHWDVGSLKPLSDSSCARPNALSAHSSQSDLPP